MASGGHVGAAVHVSPYPGATPHTRQNPLNPNGTDSAGYTWATDLDTVGEVCVP